MKKWLIGAVLTTLLIGASGCSMCRSIDQWKCDHLGWCCFGTRPSQPVCPAPGAMACPPMVECPQACPPVQGCAPIQGCAPTQTYSVPQTTPPVVISQ